MTKRFTVKMENGNQFFLPEEIADTLGIKEGDKLECTAEEGRLVFTPLKQGDCKCGCKEMKAE